MGSNFYHYTITQNLNDHQNSSTPPFCRHFLIKLDFRYVSSLNWNTTLNQFHRQIKCSRSLAFFDYYGPRMVHTLFSGSGLPAEFVQGVVFRDLIGFIKEIDSDPRNAGYEVIEIEIQVFVEEERIKFTPASKLAIEGLERLKLGEIEGGGDFVLPIKKRRRVLVRSEECAICMEEFQVRSEEEEVVRMPCRHLYHENCIVRWLEESRFCPLCRYAMQG